MFDPTANSFDNEAVRQGQKREHPMLSKGCENCRHRKIKCDERHPVCSRCLARGVKCDYRDWSALIFRDETSSAASKVHQRIWSRQRGREGIALSRQLLPSVHQTAVIMRFFYDFVNPTPSLSGRANPNGGYFAPIPSMYRCCNPDSCFAAALSAAANANFWRRHKSTQAQSDGLKDYTRALQLLRSDLQRRQRSHVPPDTLAATSLLAMYELSMTRDVSRRGYWTAHVHGTVALLESDDGNDHETRDLAGIPQAAIIQVLVDCLITGERPRLPYERCTSVAASDVPPAALPGFMFRIAHLCADWTHICFAYSMDHVQQNSEIDSIVEKIRVLDEEIEDWMNHRPESHAVVFLDNTQQNVPAPLWPLFEAPGAPNTLHLCPDMDQTFRWQFYRACRLTLLRTMMIAVNTALANATTDDAISRYESIEARVHSRMARLIDGLLCTVFSTLSVHIPGGKTPESMTDIQGFRGFELLWPLHVAGNCLLSMDKHCPNGIEKLEWVRTLFRCIRDDLGIQAANNFLQVNGARGPATL